MITSTKNRQVASAARLRRRGLRERQERFLVEGAQPVEEAVRAGVVEALYLVADAGGRVPAVADAARRAGVPVAEVGDRVMGHLTSTVTPQGIVAVARFVDVPLEALPVEAGITPVLCSVRDPGNAGTILRSADAAGAAGVVFSTGSVDVYNPKTVRSSAGSLFHVPVVREAPVEDTVHLFRARGAQVLAAAADGEVSMHDVDLARPTALLLGNEAWGLPPEVRALADRSVRVPIRGRAESLNLAAAATLLLFEAARPREGSGTGLVSLIARAGHDARLPLTALKGFGATLVQRWERLDEATRRDMVAGMGVDVERVAAMTGLLVDAAKLEEGSLRLNREAGDVGETAAWLAALFARSPDHPEVRASGSARAAVDRERLRAVLLTLCDAAVWWGRMGPVEIAVEAGDDGAVIEVRREGGGPDPEEAARMFEGPDGGGTVAMHIAQRLVEFMGGHLTVTGGDEVRFRLTLPR